MSIYCGECGLDPRAYECELVASFDAKITGLSFPLGRIAHVSLTVSDRRDPALLSKLAKLSALTPTGQTPKVRVTIEAIQ